MTSEDFDVAEVSRASVLVVDDSLINRKKISLAVSNLGHEVATAKDGRAAMEALRQSNYDAILLDIIMPEMDGFDVLRALEAEPLLRDIPVVVISALDDEKESVVKAIELGAEDFLPKDFDPILLRARLNASLAKKRFRDQEKEYFSRIEKLTEAAEVLESGRFDPESLKLDALKKFDDPLGRLAAVFSGMAAEIYNRELKLRTVIQTLQGILLVIAAGVIWGSSPSLSRIASGLGATPVALAAWVNLIVATSCLTVATYKGVLPKLNLSKFIFFVKWAVIAGILQRLTLLFVAGHVEASLLSLIAALQGFIVFAFAAISKLEQVNFRRLIGVLLGLGGVALVVSSKLELSSGGNDWVWLCFALLLPVWYAVEWVFVAAKRPKDIGFVPGIGIMSLISCVFLVPAAFIFEGGMTLSNGFGQVELLALLMGVVTSISLVVSYNLLGLAGPIFASQSAYVMTIAGIGWGMVLLNEELSGIAWISVAVIIAGLILVAPKIRNEKVIINRSFTRE